MDVNKNKRNPNDKEHTAIHEKYGNLYLGRTLI